MASSNTASDPWVTRIQPAIDLLVHKLNELSPSQKKYVFQWTDGRGLEFFSIAEKAPPGEKWPSGSKWKTHRGPTRRQLEIIEQTSHSVPEITNRIMDLVLQGIDSTRMVSENQPGTGASMSKVDIEKLVAERLQQVLSDPRVVQALVAKQQTPETVAAKPQEALKELPSGVRERKPRRNLKAARDAEIAVVKERMSLMGLRPDDLKLRWDGSISRKWLADFEVAWTAHVNATRPSK